MSDAASVRAWAREAGLPVGVRGRLKPELLAAYHLAHTAGPTQDVGAGTVVEVGRVDKVKARPKVQGQGKFTIRATASR